MSKGINKVILIGRLGSDPDIRYTQNGKAVTTISIATSERWKTKPGNSKSALNGIKPYFSEN